MLNLSRYLCHHGTAAFVTIWLTLGWHPPAALATVDHCEQLKTILRSLTTKTAFSTSPQLYMQSAVNQGAMKRFLDVIDNQKMFLITADLQQLAHVSQHNLSELFKPNNSSESCHFINHSRDVFRASVNRAQQIITQTLNLRMDFARPEKIIMNHSYLDAPQTHDELADRWRRQLKLEKLLMVKPTSIHPPEMLHSPHLNQLIATKYQQLFTKYDYDELFYYYWIKALTKTIDPHAHPILNQQWRSHFFRISPHLTHPLLTLPSDILIKHGFAITTQGYELKFKESYPHNYILPHIKKGTIIGNIAAPVSTAANSHLNSPKSTSTLHTPPINSSQLELTTIEPHHDHFVYALKTAPRNTKMFMQPKIFVYGIKVKSASQANQHHNLLVIKVRHLLNSSSVLSYQQQSKALHSFIKERLHRWQNYSDALILDLRGTKSVGGNYHQAVSDFLGIMFGGGLPLFQRIETNPSNRSSNPLVTTKNIRMRVSQSFPHNGFSPSIPVTLLIDDQTHGYFETFAHTLRLMNRVVVIGSGTPSHTKGNVFFRKTTHMTSATPNQLITGFHYTRNLLYHIDGTLNSATGINYDIHLSTTAQSESHEPAPLLLSHPWHQDIIQNIQATTNVMALDYPNFNMVPKHIVTTLTKLYHQGKGFSAPPSSLPPPRLEFDDHRDKPIQLSLNWQDYKYQMDQSQLAIKRLETTTRNLAEDARAVSKTGRPKHHQALTILKQDYVLMNTLQLTSHYYYLLKKGNSASHFVPIAINEMGEHHHHN